MLLEKTARAIQKVSFPASLVANRISQIILVMMMLLITVDVILRNSSNIPFLRDYELVKPIPGAYELIQFMLIAVIFLGMAHTEAQGSHLSVDFVFKKLSAKAQNFVLMVSHLLCLAVFSIITWRSLHGGLFVLEQGEVSGILSIPLFPFYWIVALGSGLLTINYLVRSLDSLHSIQVDFENKAWISFTVAGILLFFFFSTPWWLNMLPWEIGPGTVGVFGLLLMLFFIFSGIYIGPVLAALGFLGLAYLSSIDGGLSILGSSPYTTSSLYTYSSLPLFVLMCMFWFHADLGSDIYFTLRQWVGRLPGGLAMATVGGCAGFAAVSGSSLATAATMGTVALPEMRKYKYNEGLATGCIAAGGSMGILIPPSIALIIYAQMAEEGIGELFIAGIIPGLLEASLYLLVIYIICTLRPSFGPKAPSSTWKEKLISLKGSLPILLLFALVIGGIYAGFVTPSEAAGIGASGGLLLGTAMKRLSWAKAKEAVSSSINTTTMLFLMIIGADIFAKFLTMTDIPIELGDMVSGLQIPNIMILIIMLLLYAIMGTIMPIFLIIILTVPIFLPLVVGMGYSPIWFGIMMVMIIEMGGASPPFGINIFVIKSVAGDIPLTTIYKGIIPFIAADFIRIALVLFIPALALFLPSLM